LSHYETTRLTIGGAVRQRGLADFVARKAAMARRSPKASVATPADANAVAPGARPAEWDDSARIRECFSIRLRTAAGNRRLARVPHNANRARA
jgi:hypothetical protein